jgi:hypothetical protein
MPKSNVFASMFRSAIENDIMLFAAQHPVLPGGGEGPAPPPFFPKAYQKQLTLQERRGNPSAAGEKGESQSSEAQPATSNTSVHPRVPNKHTHTHTFGRAPCSDKYKSMLKVMPKRVVHHRPNLVIYTREAGK